MGKASNRKWYNRIFGLARAKLENLDQEKMKQQLEKFRKLYPERIK